METVPGFSYLRLGDGEVNWMLRRKGITSVPMDRYSYRDATPRTPEEAYSVTGLEARHELRLRNAYEQCSYLDTYESVPGVPDGLPLLELGRAEEAYRNPNPETSKIFFAWVQCEMRSYLRRHRSIFAGAEAPLLGSLHSDPIYRELAAAYWPQDGFVDFCPIRENGRHYSENLDLIKEELAERIKATSADTLFLALATGAKIICYELAKELGIVAFDFGSAIRALTYSATPGYHVYRSFHNPYLFRVPLPVFMNSWKRAHPEATPAMAVTVAHAQLMLDLQRKVVGDSLATDVCDSSNFDPTGENMDAFRRNLAFYRRELLPPIINDKEVRIRDEQFRKWTTRNGLNWKGRALNLLRKSVRMFRRT